MKFTRNTAPDPRRATKSPSPDRRQRPTPPKRLLAALELPEMPLETRFTSEPSFTRGPRGWYRIGLFA